MKINRLHNTNLKKPSVNYNLTTPKGQRRRTLHPKKESATESITQVTDLLNARGKFSYSDFERNRGMIELFRHQINQAIFNYGVDLQYFRRYNTFFKDEEENTSNLIYGEDTTAEFYASRNDKRLCGY